MFYQFQNEEERLSIKLNTSKNNVIITNTEDKEKMASKTGQQFYKI